MSRMTILTEAELRRIVTLDLEAVACIENAFRALATLPVAMPPILRLDMPEQRGEVDVKTAYVPGIDGFAIKISPGFFDNPKLGLPSVNGMMVLLSAKTGLIEALQVRDVSLMWRAVFALTIGYSAFIAEIFRAGIQSVDKGQIEAAKALGLTRVQRFRLVVFPQALRVVFPPLSNDFVAMVKDSSLVSVLGVADITQMGKVYASGSFRFFETYSIVAYVYLVLTIGLSLALRGVEKRMRRKFVR